MIIATTILVEVGCERKLAFFLSAVKVSHTKHGLNIPCLIGALLFRNYSELNQCLTTFHLSHNAVE
jgi:hypothetical protein